MSSGDFPLVVMFWMNRSMGVAGVIVGEGEVVVSVFLTIWGWLFPLVFPAV